MKQSLNRSLLIGFGFSLLILLLSSIASYVSISNLLNNTQLVNHSNKVITGLVEVLSTLKDAETGQRGYIITGDNMFLEPYTGSYDKALGQISEVKQLVSDNPAQVAETEKLKTVVIKKLQRLQYLMDQKKAGVKIATEDLIAGKEHMDEARSIVQKMQDTETTLLKTRSQKMERFASFTPGLIIAAAIISLIIASFFYFRIKEEIEQRAELQDTLVKKDKEISTRVEIIQKLADQISKGDYNIRISDDEKDAVGNIALSLNKMAESLEKSFTILKDNEWAQSSTAGLNKIMLGEKNTTVLANDILTYLANHLEAPIGAFYLLGNDGKLHLESGYALSKNNKKQSIALGEGLAGQAAFSKKEIVVRNINEQDLLMDFSAGKICPSTIIAYPVLFEQRLTGVVELGFARTLLAHEIAFLKNSAGSIGIAITTAQNRLRLQELLEETQSQTEELQAQHTELENMNAEMEVQTEKLQASEEELKVQQEELMEINHAIEERNKLLEERNQIIAERNLEIQKKADALAQSTKYKSEFLANMSHELRTPLNSILLLSRLMSENIEKNLSPDQVEYAKVIQNSGNGLLELIDEILDLSKIEAGKMQLEYAPVVVKDILNNMNMLFAPMAREKKIDFNTILLPGVPEVIETDRMRLEQVLKNLLANAIKFTANGFIHLTVSVSPANPGDILFSVKDSGIGISAEKQELIFEAFQQADGSTRRKYGGTGLGLSISRELARLLNGDITLQSEPGKGSEFVVSISSNKRSTPAVQYQPTPIVPARVDTIKLQNEITAERKFVSERIPEEIPDDRQNIGTDEKTILIIEDDTNFAKTLLDYTHKKGYKGVVCVRGDAAVDMAKTFQPAGILLDIQLPVKSGFDVMDELKNNPETRHIPVHILSSFDLKKESISKGAADFINKPVSIEKINGIFEKLEYILNRHSRKVLIIEDNSHHAKALSYYLGTNQVNAVISGSIENSIITIKQENVDCVILDMGVPDANAYQLLDTLKSSKDIQDVPIIVFTGKNLSLNEEFRIKQYADSIVIKTAHSYRRILDEVSIFLHVLQSPDKNLKKKVEKIGALHEVLKDKKVLIADDDVRNIFSITKALELYKMKVLPAMDGKEALDILEENNKVDIILMDIMMPNIDGFEAITTIKNDKRYKNIPIIAVTAKAMVGDREKCIKAGASDYISKPVDIDQLISLLRVWLYDKGF